MFSLGRLLSSPVVHEDTDPRLGLFGRDGVAPRRPTGTALALASGSSPGRSVEGLPIHATLDEVGLSARPQVRPDEGRARKDDISSFKEVHNSSMTALCAALSFSI